MTGRTAAACVLAGGAFWGAMVSVSGASFVNWENPHVHPLDLTPDRTKLLAVNTADNRLEVFDVTSGAPVAIGAVPVGLDPVSVRARTNTQAWVVNHISDSVSVVDLTTMNVVTTIRTDDEPADVIFAGSPERAFVTCSQANTVLVIDPANPNAAIMNRSALPAGGTPSQLGVTVRLPIAGEDPRALARNADGSEVYVLVFESRNHSTILGGGDASGGTMFGPNVVNDPLSPYFDPGQPPALGLNPPNPPPNDGTAFRPPIAPGLPPPPRVGLIVKKNGAGAWMDDNAHDWTDLVSGPNAGHSRRPVGWDVVDHDVGVLDTAALGLRYVGSLMNVCMAVDVNPASGRVTVVGTDATNEVRFEPVLNGRFLRVDLGSFDPAGPANPAVVDLNPHLSYTDQLPFQPIPQTERDKSIGDPRGVVWNAAGTRGYISGMGSNNVLVVDAVGAPLRPQPIEVGAGPTGLALDETRDRLYVLNKFDASVTIIDTVTEAELLPRVPLHDPTPPVIRLGRKHLYDTHRTSGLGHLSCASCHVDARTDRLAWDLGHPGGAMKPFNQNCNADPQADCQDWHPMKGPMTTQTLQDIIGLEPHHWRGDRNGIEEFAGAFEGLLGDDGPLPLPDMMEFEEFLATIAIPPSPFRTFNNGLPTNLPLPGHFSTGRFFPPGLPAGAPLPNGNADNGLSLFRPPGLNGITVCTACHTIPVGAGTDGFFVGFQFQPLPPGSLGEHHLMITSADGSTNRSIKVPQLRTLYEKVGFDTTQVTNLSGFGFLHDGSVDSLARFVSLPAFSTGSDQQVADLVAFLLSFAGSGMAPGSPNNPLDPPGPPSQDTHAAVGRQTTLVRRSTAPAVQLTLIDDMLALANTGAVGLVVKGRQVGVQRGYAYLGGGLFQSDRAEEIVGALALSDSATPGSELTYTIVPIGSEIRIGIDRDEDGFFDREELDGCSDPSDPAVVPPLCPDFCGGIANMPCGDSRTFCRFPEGECCCDLRGTCELIPLDCPTLVDPVCGCDGVSYENACLANMAGASLDHAGPCAQACEPVAAAQRDPDAVATNRYLSFVPGAVGTVAIQVTFDDLPSPFHVLNGRSMWVGPPRAISENPGSGAVIPGVPVFMASTLRCAPYFQDWSAVGTLNVYHEDIVPDGFYSVRLVDWRCAVDDPANFSDALAVGMSPWGDVCGPWDPVNKVWPAPDGGIDVIADVVATLDKFAGLSTAPVKTRVDLHPSTPNQVIDILDITVMLDAFQGDGYPFAPSGVLCVP